MRLWTEELAEGVKLKICHGGKECEKMKQGKVKKGLAEMTVSKGRRTRSCKSRHPVVLMTHMCKRQQPHRHLHTSVQSGSKLQITLRVKGNQNCRIHLFGKSTANNYRDFIGWNKLLIKGIKGQYWLVPMTPSINRSNKFPIKS